MKKYHAHIIVYSWTQSTDDTDAIDKFREFVRREHLSVKTDKVECNRYSLAFPDDVLQKIKSFSESDSPMEFEHRYHLFLTYPDLTKIHRVLSLIQSYASYIGIHYVLSSLKCVP